MHVAQRNGQQDRCHSRLGDLDCIGIGTPPGVRGRVRGEWDIPFFRRFYHAFVYLGMDMGGPYGNSRPFAQFDRFAILQAGLVPPKTHVNGNADIGYDSVSTGDGPPRRPTSSWTVATP